MPRPDTVVDLDIHDLLRLAELVAQLFRIQRGCIEHRSSLKRLELAGRGYCYRFFRQPIGLGLAQLAEGTRLLDRVPKNRQAIDPVVELS